MKPTAWARVASAVDLPPATASFVLTAHLFVLLSTIPLLVVLEVERAALAAALPRPWLIQAGMAVYTAGVAFECAQNTIDRWYLTHTDEAFCDGLFYSFMIAGFSLVSMGAHSASWLWAVVALIALLHPLSYVAGSWVRFLLLTASLLLVDLALYLALGDPTVFVHTLATCVGLMFLWLLMRTRAQWLHGIAAVCFGLSLLAFPWAMIRYAHGTPMSWGFALRATLAVGALLALAFPALARAAPSPRPSRSPAEQLA